MTIRFDGQVAIVTGAGNGLGRTYARALALLGARVAVVDLGQGELSAAASRVADEIIAGGGTAAAYCVDVTDVEQVNAMARHVIALWGQIDILINNAGALLPGSFANSNLEHLKRAMDVNYWGTVHACKAVWDSMHERGYGRIVVTTSSAGLYGSAGIFGYCAAKSALIGLMNALHAEGASHGIHVNAISPTAATDMNRKLLPPQILPLMDPEAVTPAVLFLVSREGPSQTILNAGAGVYGISGIVEAAGEYLSPEERNPDTLRDRFAAISTLDLKSSVDSSYGQVVKMVSRAARAQNVDIGDLDAGKPSAD